MCELKDEVAGEIVHKFYKSLDMVSKAKLVSKVGGKKIEFTRKDLINSFDLPDHWNDEDRVSMGKSDILKLLNDGIGKFMEKDVFNTEFELLMRLLH